MKQDSGLPVVAILMGGQSGEHAVSMVSGTGVLDNIDTGLFCPLPVEIGEDGAWRFPDDPDLGDVPLWKGLEIICSRADLVFPVLHGPNGEDGSMQGMLELAGMPFVGSDHYASSLAMNKPRAKDVYRSAGLPTPGYLWASAAAIAAGRRGFLDRVASELGFPCVVKTPKLGSSVGVEIARSAEALDEVVERILPIAGELMVEAFVKGVELTVSVIEDPDDGMVPLALPVIEIRPRVSGWFDFRAKYEEGGSDELCPAPISRELTQRVQAMGVIAHQVLGCSGMSRTDVIVDADSGTPYAIETNTIPGFTPTSLLPQAAAAHGISYKDLVTMLVRGAL